MDEIDTNIVEILEKNALISSDAVAKMVNTSPPTVRRRIAKLVKDGIINIVAKVSLEKVGPYITIGIGMHTDTDKIDSIAAKLIQHPHIKQVAFTTGTCNLQALTTFRSTDDFSNFLQTYLSNIEGLKVVETNIFIKKWGGD